MSGPHHRAVPRLGSSRFGSLWGLRPLGLVLLVATCSGCGGGSGPSPNAPTISNLRVSFAPGFPAIGAPTQVQFIVDVVDPDGDWVLGECHFVTGNQLVVPVETPAPGLASNATSGTAVCGLVEIFQNETVQIDLTVVDQAGHQSNIVSGLVNLEGRRARRQ
jgi:hypothetical protein